jgi:hypothetical protein
MLVVSGTHGPEGFVGAAAQIALLKELATTNAVSDVKIVLVHAVNPWGFAHLSRTTENNVDLNRNFIEWDQPVPANPSYGELHAHVCPADFAPETLGPAQAAIDAFIEAHGFDAYSDATMRGQYTHATGLNYGGAGREWSNCTLESILTETLSGARRIAFIDWHTGLGERGEPFFLCFNERGSAAWRRACGWWGADRIETTGGFSGAGRPRYTGLLFHGVQRFAAHAEVTGAVIEFGTEPREAMRRALQLDLQLKFGTSIAPQDYAPLREQVLEAFAPTSSLWRRNVLGHAIEIQHQTLHGLRAW